jgi:glyoxylase-like metal-dependent hydrolase (beta-lactamase superfamily II)
MSELCQGQTIGKKLSTIYVSHGDPDFYFGLEEFKKYFPAYAAAATVGHI